MNKKFKETIITILSLAIPILLAIICFVSAVEALGVNIPINECSCSINMSAGDLIPSITNTYNIGNTSNQWKNLWLSGNINTTLDVSDRITTSYAYMLSNEWRERGNTLNVLKFLNGYIYPDNLDLSLGTVAKPFTNIEIDGNLSVGGKAFILGNGNINTTQNVTAEYFCNSSGSCWRTQGATSTYNSTYNTWAYNQTESIYFYNMSNLSWIQWAYNQTANIYFYNQTDTIYFYNMSNLSWLQWAYNQTANVYFYNQTVSVYFYNMTSSPYFYNMSDGKPNYTNIAYTNQTNNFTTLQVFDKGIASTNATNHTKILQIEPHASGDNSNLGTYDSGIGASFFSNTTSNPALCVYGNDTEYTKTVRAGCQYMDKYGRYNFGGPGGYASATSPTSISFSPTLGIEFGILNFGATSGLIIGRGGSPGGTSDYGYAAMLQKNAFYFLNYSDRYVEQGTTTSRSPHIGVGGESSTSTNGHRLDMWFDDYTSTTTNQAFMFVKNGSLLINVSNNLNIVANWTNITNNLDIEGNLSVKRPYGMYSSSQTQTIAVASTAYNVTFNMTEDAYLINKNTIDNCTFTFQQSGDYLIELSAIVTTTSGSNRHVEIWVEKNNVNVPRSNTKVEISTSGQEQTLAVPFILDMNTTDIFRVKWASDSTTAQLLWTNNTLYSPEVPSIIMTITKISEITP